jgi:hypothetical protein
MARKALFSTVYKLPVFLLALVKRRRIDVQSKLQQSALGYNLPYLTHLENISTLA